jgi:hypothetical protein
MLNWTSVFYHGINDQWQNRTTDVDGQTARVRIGQACKALPIKNISSDIRKDYNSFSLSIQGESFLDTLSENMALIVINCKNINIFMVLCDSWIGTKVECCIQYFFMRLSGKPK